MTKLSYRCSHKSQADLKKKKKKGGEEETKKQNRNKVEENKHNLDKRQFFGLVP